MIDKELKTALAVFDPIQAEFNKIREHNHTAVFDYKDPTGNKMARSHIFTLRKVKTRVTEAHKEAKAKVLEIGKVLDEKRRDLINQVDAMIEIHDAPLRALEAAKLEEQRIAEEQAKAAEQARQDAIAAKERELLAKERELKAREEEAARKEREAAIAREAESRARREAEERAKAERAAAEARLLAEQNRLAQEAAAREQALKDAALAEKARQAAREQALKDAALAEQARQEEALRRVEEEHKAQAAAHIAEQNRLANVEAARIANLEHRAKVEAEAFEDIMGCCGTIEVLRTIMLGKIRHVSLNY